MNFLRQSFWFTVSGVVGFMVDAGVLHLLIGSLGLYWARLVSFLSAVFITWLFNRTITFSVNKSDCAITKEFCIYLGLMLVGGFVNYSLYVLLITKYDVIARYPVLGVAAGSMAGMIVNLHTSRFILFRFTRD